MKTKSKSKDFWTLSKELRKGPKGGNPAFGMWGFSKEERETRLDEMWRVLKIEILQRNALPAQPLDQLPFFFVQKS